MPTELKQLTAAQEEPGWASRLAWTAASLAVLLVIWAVLAAIGLHSLVEYPLWYGPFQIAAAISVGLLWATRERESVPDYEHLLEDVRASRRDRTGP